MFESVAGLPVLAAAAACMMALLSRNARTLVSVVTSGATCGLGLFLLFRIWSLVDGLSGHQYDEGCGRITAWVYQYPLLNLATRPISAVALVAAVTATVVGVMYRAARTRVA